MAAEPSLIASTTAKTAAATTPTPEKRYRSIFDVPKDFFDSCSLLSSSATSVFAAADKSENDNLGKLTEERDDTEIESSKAGAVVPRWTCNTCKAEFESLQDQRSHFKSDIHRINVKLSIAGKHIVNEDDFDEVMPDALRDCDLSSISGSEDEDDRGSLPSSFNVSKQSLEAVKQKLYFRLRTGERISLWKCLFLSESERVSYDDGKAASSTPQCLTQSDVIERLKFLMEEPRDKRHFRIMLLASGGHFAGCVFDGSSVVVHKTFHRYVVRAKAGKKQSSKDGTGRAAHSAGASLRRHNELSLKKDIQELFTAWKPYFDASSCVFIHAPSSNHQLFLDGDKAYFSHQHSVIRNIPISVRRPTFKEARRIYSLLTQVSYEMDEIDITLDPTGDLGTSADTLNNGSSGYSKEDLKDRVNDEDTMKASSSVKSDSDISKATENENLGTTTSLHEASHAGDCDKVLELLEEGLDPCVKDQRGRTPYMLANEKEVRNVFRRFMALNLDRWDWHDAKVPSPLTKEMEESQAAKQAEKDAKKKARAKELKKLRKAKEKKAQAEASLAKAAAVVKPNPQASSSVNKGGLKLSKEEEQRRAAAEEREKRAAAAERRMAATAAASGGVSAAGPSASQPKVGLAIATDLNCSCCNASLSCLVPFHRYNYKYCSSSCMHVHKEILEDG
ncbi:Ankyrin repeat and zinc finger domain-containing protein 1 [Linum perenne]